MKQYQYRVTVSPGVGRALERIAQATGQPGRRIIRDWLEGATEGLEMVAEAVEAAKALEGSVKADYAAGFTEAAKQAEGLQEDLFRLIRELERETGQVGDKGLPASTPPRRGKGVGAGGPPTCNNGGHKRTEREQTRTGQEH